MEYDIDHDQAGADPKHCAAVLKQESEELRSKINNLLEDFLRRTDLRLKGISFISTDNVRGEQMIDVNLQFEL